MVPLASWARTGPRRSPPVSAPVIARPDLAAIDQATEAGLDSGVLQGVAGPGDLADPLADDLGAVADHVPGGLDLGRRDEAAGQQPALQQVRQPFGVGIIFSELRR
jgi:hypothetical protein